MLRMDKVAVLLLPQLLCTLLGVHCSVKLSNIPKISVNSRTVDLERICTTIKFVDESRRTKTRKSVLQDLCIKGVHHVGLDDKLKQFAVFNIHRDAFDSQPKWLAGDAKDVINDPTWEVNSVNKLGVSGYQWYSNGMPMWPLPHQAMASTLKPGSPTPASPPSGRKSPIALLKKPKETNWPNYGLATPVYFASNAWRNQAWSLEEFFQEVLKIKPTKQTPAPFQNAKEFHKLAKSLMQEVDGASVEAYTSWPFLQYSLTPMIETMVRKNKGICPDEVFIYTRYTPCHPKEAKHLSCSHAAQQARNLLTQVNCRTTDVIQGYSEDYINNAL